MHSRFCGTRPASALFARGPHRLGDEDRRPIEDLLQHPRPTLTPGLVVDMAVLGPHRRGVVLVLAGRCSEHGEVGVEQHTGSEVVAGAWAGAGGVSGAGVGSGSSM